MISNIIKNPHGNIYAGSFTENGLKNINVEEFVTASFDVNVGSSMILPSSFTVFLSNKYVSGIYNTYTSTAVIPKGSYLRIRASQLSLRTEPTSEKSKIYYLFDAGDSQSANKCFIHIITDDIPSGTLNSTFNSSSYSGYLSIWTPNY